MHILVIEDDARVAEHIGKGLRAAGHLVDAEKDGGEKYEAHCTSTYRRLEHEVWKVVQHQQTPVPA